VKRLRPLMLSLYFRPSYNAPLEVNAMKLRSLVVRLIVLWIPVLPPTPLIARAQRQASLIATPVHVTAAAGRGSEMSVTNRE
jgi:hypothetical protein